MGSNERKTEVPYLLWTPKLFLQKKIVVCLKGVKGVLVLNRKNALGTIEGKGPITNRLLDDLLVFNETSILYEAHGPIHLIKSRYKGSVLDIKNNFLHLMTI